MMRKTIVLALLALSATAQEPGPLPGTALLVGTEDLAAAMVAQIGEQADRLTESLRTSRAERWHRDTASAAAYDASVAENRTRLRSAIGAVEKRVPPAPEFIAPIPGGATVGKGPGYTVQAVRWHVLPGITGEGLLLQPKNGAAAASVIALPDCDVTPEALCGLAEGVPEKAQFARHLAEQGLRVLVPVLIDRADTFSGDPAVRYTNQPHREFVYRAGFDLGRHPIGYEVQKVEAAVDWLAEIAGGAPVGVMGHGEGGLIAFYAAALDTRIAAAAVSGYFGPREGLWSEPIYRNVFGLLREFGDAEIASLIAPRALVVETANAPAIAGPPAPREGRGGAAPGAITTPDAGEVQSEIIRARTLAGGLQPAPVLQLVSAPDGLPGQDGTFAALLAAMGLVYGNAATLPAPAPEGTPVDPVARTKRQFDELVEHLDDQLGTAQQSRATFWEKADATSVESWEKSTASYRDYLWDEVIGRLPSPTLPANPRARQIYDEPAYTGYEVQLDVCEGIFAYGILLVPKNIGDGEKRPVVVCQHGLEGRPDLLTEPGTDDAYYHRFAGRLAERGYITFSPQNPYIGEDRFRVLQRKLNPLGLSLFSVIAAQHACILEWLATQPNVDASRIGFYGLSYGGKTAMRVPALLTKYAFSICSADYNEWIWKNASTRSRYSYVFTGEYEIFEWNLGNTFNYAELSWLICPRPFMVERGHGDGVAPDEWVAYEYARTRQRYDLLGIGDRTEMEVFNGPHTINGKGTFAFIDRQFGGPFVSTQ